MEKIKVEVFGMKDQYPATGGCGCGPAQSMGEMYSEFMERISSNELYENMEITFVEYSNDLEGFDYVKEAHGRGYSLPLTAINGRVRFHSSIPFNQVIRLVKQQMK
ncbi:hypothetical protein EZV73_08080 [Acidaminobacter sp. JC074]|uniref:hypothetical protein n=1 Tax=Acidaminobacter sp. JC074 TaxID=2530199 RepID=UPI001F0E4688|nr:hypothetical protein [Acidaminobacter sp. JC074]MCH4887526.1 hypothetical protein [Acidaminobacter sp. JC074]